MSRKGLRTGPYGNVRIAGKPRAVQGEWCLRPYGSRSGRGIPRLINILAHKSLMLAYGRGERWVAPHHVRMAMADTQIVALQRHYGWWLVGILLAVLLWLVWQERGVV